LVAWIFILKGELNDGYPLDQGKSRKN